MRGAWLVGVLLWASGSALAAPPERVLLTRFSASNTLLQRLADGLTRAMRERLDRVPGLSAQGPAEAGAPEASAPEPGWVLSGRVEGGSRPRRAEVQLARSPGGEVVWKNGEFLGEAPEAARDIAEQVLVALRDGGFHRATVEGQPALEAERPPEAGPSRTPGWVVTGVGGATLLGGGVAWAVAGASLVQLQSKAWRSRQTVGGISEATRGFTTTTVVATALSASGAVIGAFGLIWALTTPAAPAPVVTVAPGWGGVVVGGAW